MILMTTEAAGKLTCCRLRLAQFEFDILHRADVKLQATDALSRLKSKGSERAPLEDEVPVLTVSPKPLACTHLPVKPELETIEKLKGSFSLSLTDSCKKAGIFDKEKEEIPTLSEFLIAESTNSDCRANFVTVENPTSRLNVGSYGVLVRIYLPFKWWIPEIFTSLLAIAFSTILPQLTFSRPTRRASNVRLHEK